ncbi:MAG: TetR/AcrR family transcriptional regulator C-terminal domain-containing protein [Demequinaceae bacterium]|nr:TetR/AcrR family transcriptional regulator C-terminal domain-containing protein [Demequinaceae bacterium]
MTETTEGSPAGERPTRPTLSREYIVSIALSIIDRDGLDRFSMRRLGAEIGVDPMAVYHYFPSKADLFDGLVEAVWMETEIPQGSSGRPWLEDLVGYLTAIRAALRRHPAALPAVATRPIKTQPFLDLVEVVATRLVRAGATPADALDAINVLVYFVSGHALAEVGEPVGGPDSPEINPEGLDMSAIPTLVEAIGSGYEFDADRQFDLGLRSLLKGLGERLGLSDPADREASDG